MITIDGSFGEGGGQILRTALTLSAIMGEPFRIDQIRIKRNNPGLAPQHLAGVQALAKLTDAEVTGAELGATSLTFAPHTEPSPGTYTFDVADASENGSAGATTLLLQTIFLPLAFARQDSFVTLRGGTHVAWCPSYHYVAEVFVPTVSRLGLNLATDLESWGFYPAGGGEVQATMPGGQQVTGALNLEDRGEIDRVHGLAVAANLPSHIAQRMANRAMNVLQEAGIPADITPQRVRSAGPGAGLFLTAEYEHIPAGFSALGEPGKPSEQVADEACEELLTHHRSGEPLDQHLADQLLLPAALAQEPSSYRTSRVTQHLLTNAHVIQLFLPASIQIDAGEGQPGAIQIHPRPK